MKRTNGARWTPLALAIAACLWLPAVARAAEPKPAPTAAGAAATGVSLEPKAMELVKAMSARLAGAKSMSFTAVSTYESPSRFGPPLLYSTISDVTLQRPDKLKVISPGDGPASEFYYDGKKVMAFAPAEELVAVADAPPTIDGTLEMAYESADIYFPFTDVIVSDPYKAIADGLRVAFYIGQSKAVGGTTTDMVAVANDRVFAQIWIGAEDKLPRRSRATYLGDPSRLRQQVDLSDWRLDGSVPADAFSSARAAAAKPIPFARPDPVLPSGAFPSPESEGAKTKK
jgi:hypothetical protein